MTCVDRYRSLPDVGRVLWHGPERAGMGTTLALGAAAILHPLGELG